MKRAETTAKVEAKFRLLHAMEFPSCDFVSWWLMNLPRRPQRETTDPLQEFIRSRGLERLRTRVLSHCSEFFGWPQRFPAYLPRRPATPVVESRLSPTRRAAYLGNFPSETCALRSSPPRSGTCDTRHCGTYPTHAGVDSWPGAEPPQRSWLR